MADTAHGSPWAFERFCACLNRYEVDYIVVGSEAVAFHGAPRFSADTVTNVVAGEYGAAEVRFLSLDDLIRNKRAAGRPKDLADVAALGGAPGLTTEDR